MAFTSGRSSGASAEINVTPLIDVLLVLLIIFMVIVPVVPRGLAALLPQPANNHTAAAPEPPIVVQVHAAPGGGVVYQINQQSLARPLLAGELGRIFAGRQDRTMFVRGDRDLEFSAVADVVALGRQVSAERVGILTPGTEAAQWPSH